MKCTKELATATRLRSLKRVMEYKQIGISPQDSQFLETRKFQVEDIARIYRVPLHLIQNLDKATNNNI